MNKQKKSILLLVVFIALLVLVRYSPVGNALTFENLKQHRDELLSAVQGHRALSALLFIGLYVAVTALSIPGAAVLTLAGGLFFGTIAATVYVNIGATAGASLAFLVARYLLGNRLQEKYGTQLAKFNDELARNGTSYLLTLRFIPLFPFFLINFLSGLTKIPLPTFLWTTSVGIIPGTAVFAFAGRQLGTINSLSEVLSRKTLVAFVVLGLFALVPAGLKKLRRRNKGR